MMKSEEQKGEKSVNEEDHRSLVWWELLRASLTMCMQYRRFEGAERVDEHESAVDVEFEGKRIIL
jgi:hypothetical protein